MPAHEGGLRLDRLREAVAERVDAQSLRRVAREVGMSPTGLQKFLHGATPYSATRRKLERWYVREVASYGGAPDAESLRAALHILGRDLPRGERERALADIVQRLETAYRDAGLAPPPWLAEIRVGVGGRDA
ncbi:MAG TPA: hypothetical protein VF158_01055 [Longimicrobiales bacterium]